MPLPLAGIALWSAITAFIAKILPMLICWVLIVLGVSLVAYSGIQIALDQIESVVNNRLGELPSDLYAVARACGILDFLAIIFSAKAVAIGINLATQGKKVVFKGFNLTGWGSQ